ncbi:MAG: hypothetical protein AAF721_14895, partial [Myxococcota bacterium]
MPRAVCGATPRDPADEADCPDEEALVAWVEGALGDRAEELELHIERCNRCAAAIAAIQLVPASLTRRASGAALDAV